MTTITVAIATCGRPDALARCLDAVAAGSEQPDEVLVVDQDPSASSAAAVARLGAIPHRQLVQGRRGLSASRNLALHSARMDAIALTDDDCVPDTRWVELLRRELAPGAGVDAVAGTVVALDPSIEGLHAVSDRRPRQAEVHSRRVTPWRVGTGGNFSGRVGVLRDVGGWDERLGTGSAGRAAEDIELIDRLLARGHAIGVCPNVVVRHERQSTERRLATRWSYGFGIGAFIGMRLRRRDLGVLPMLVDYLRMNVVALVLAALRRDSFDVRQHGRSLLSLLPGGWYGVRLAPAGDPGR